MSFKQFHPCPKCNSRDNLAEYDNGYFCFGCGYTKSKLKRLNEEKTVKVRNDISLSKNLPKTALKWLLEYNLTKEEMESFYYAEKNGKNLLVLYADDNYYLARNLDDGIKYMSSGEKPLLMYGKRSSPHNVVIFVEDIISAIKVGRQYTAIPMLGAKLKTEWWDKLKDYDKIVIWGDRDKAIQNIRLARKARELTGQDVQTVITDLDPKCYSDKEIKNQLTKVII